MTYFAELLNKNSKLPIEICEYIITFSDVAVPVMLNRDNAMIGWFYFRLPFKHISQIRYESELDICKLCTNWSTNCVCKQLLKKKYLV